METFSATFGSDKYGLVWGYAFEPGRAARPIDCVADAVLLNGGGTNSDHEFLWLHFSLSNTSPGSDGGLLSELYMYIGRCQRGRAPSRSVDQRTLRADSAPRIPVG